MEVLDKIVTWSHVVAGGTALLTGLLAIFIGKKGGKAHRRNGRVYFWAMSWVFISALLIVIFFRFNFFLTIIAFFSFYMAFSGYRTLKIKKTKKPEWVDWFAAIFTITVGFILLGYGVYKVIETSGKAMFAHLSLFFGLFTIQTSYVSIHRFIKKKYHDPMWWWFAHMQSMGGSFIAASTAFLVQNGKSSPYYWVLWVAPTVIGTILLTYWSVKYHRQFVVKRAKIPTGP